jgi:microcystin-dependent protein
MSSSKVSRDFGSVNVYGPIIDMKNNPIKNLAEPVDQQDATTKHYVDTLKLAGDIKMSARGNDHNGWLICDGRSLNRATYAALFAIIGTNFGYASGTTFNLPDCRGRVLGGAGQGAGLTNRTLGQSVGEETHTLSTAEMPSHTHTGTTDSSGSHTHTSNAVGGSLGLITSNGSNTASGTDSTPNEPNLYASPQALTINSAGAHTHTFTTGATGNGNAHNIMQPTLFVGNIFIYSAVI